MSFQQFRRTLEINAPIEEIWEFISSPVNLKEITPDYMGFNIITKNLPAKMHEGMIIIYRVSPLFGIKTTWVTEITHIKENNFFVDEQRVGPYKMWHHQHFIEQIDNGTLMTDIVSYQLSFGILGSLVNKLIVEKKLNEIFNYRTKAISKRFAKERFC